MKSKVTVFRPVIILVAFTISLALYPQEKSRNVEYQPEVGQEGKDVVWVPTPQALVEKMLDLTDVKPGDFLIDLGSGDGRTVITAARRGIRAVGVEYNPEMVELSKRNAVEAGVGKLTDFVQADLFEYDFTGATVITMFLLPDINLRLRPILLNMKPGTRIVTNTFTMQEWHWDDTAKIEDNSTSWTTAYLWIVPAKVEGRWRLQGEYELILIQDFQMISGEMGSRGKKESLEGRLRGNEITFTIGETVYTGTVNNNIMEGKAVKDGKTTEWKAVR